jgi:hypothetical protein
MREEEGGLVTLLEQVPLAFRGFRSSFSFFVVMTVVEKYRRTQD